MDTFINGTIIKFSIDAKPSLPQPATLIIGEPKTPLDKLAEIHWDLSVMENDARNTCPRYSAQVHELARKANLAIGQLRWELTKDKLKIV